MQIKGIPRQDPAPSTHKRSDPRPSDSPEAFDFRLHRVVAKLKAIRADNLDIIELNDIWDAVATLED